mgnify:CR=1 FL=1
MYIGRELKPHHEPVFKTQYWLDSETGSSV